MTLDAYAVASSAWDEGTIDFNNAPVVSASGPLASVTVTGTTPAAYRMDLTSYVDQQIAAGASFASIAVEGTAHTFATVGFDSKEAASGAPSLALVTGTPPTPTPAPTPTPTPTFSPGNGFGTTFGATHGVAFNNNYLGVFSSIPATTDPSQFLVTINWGDGSATSAGAVTYNASSGHFDILGSHRYAAKKTYSVSILVKSKTSGRSMTLASTGKVS